MLRFWPRQRRADMSDNQSSLLNRRERLARYVVLALAVATAIIGARDYAGGWNDGSRLATVECLVDRHTWAIDRSVFVDVPYDRLGTEKPFPYSSDDPAGSVGGTQDKIRIDGHYYSHKSPVPAVLLAGCYAMWQKLTGETARERCDEFCYWLTLLSSGTAYAITVVAMFALGGALRLRLPDQLLLTGSFGLATVVPVYSRHVNDHILFLCVASLLILNLVRLAQATTDEPPTWKRRWHRLLALGSLAGLGYTIDLGSGPLLLVAAFAAVAYRLRGRLAGLAIFLSAALPWIILHQVLNYAIGGRLTPFASAAEYFDWPGSPFRRETLTGFWNHASWRGFAFYLAALLVDPGRGFLLHNLPLLPLIPGMITRLRHRPSEWPELAAMAFWAGGTCLLYGALSVNFSGDCCSIRWFVPLTAPGYFALAILIRDDTRFRYGLGLLSVLGLPPAAMMWWQGPWQEPQNVYFFGLEVVGLGAWLFWLIWAVSVGVGTTRRR
jgi:hypothetical protein